jgi:type IV pilus assembly protein PilE
LNKNASGFTLIEIMITVGIVAILTAIALPSYRDYVQRGKIVTAINNLTNQQAAMEQFYQDNRTYSTSSGFTSPCDPTNGSVYKLALTDWAFTCPTFGSSGYVIQAQGQSGATSGFKYTVDQSGNQSTPSVPSNWPTPTNSGCFITKKGMSC